MSKKSLKVFKQVAQETLDGRQLPVGLAKAPWVPEKTQSLEDVEKKEKKERGW